MADSEDEYDRKRRDKFRGERSSGDTYRSERRDDRRAGAAGGAAGGGRDDWSDRNPFRGGGGGRARPDYRDYRSPRDRYGSPGREMPPIKRMRPDWGEELRGAPRYGAYDPYLIHAWNEHYAAHGLHSGFGGHGPIMPHPREQNIGSDVQTQPAMLTLKQFLDTQDDGISDSEVLRKYSEYKLDFKRQQLNEFFVAHKDEEWFKNKYHPVESVQRKVEQMEFLQKRVEVFNELFANGNIKAVSIDTTQQDPLLRLLDTVVIKLEGGTDDDLKILDEKPRDIIYPDRVIERKVERDDDVIITSVEKKKRVEEEPKVVSPRAIRRTATVSDDEENWDEDDDDDAGGTTVATVSSTQQDKGDDDYDDDEDDNKSRDGRVDKHKEKKAERKRKHSNSDSSSSSSSDSDSSSSSSSDEDDDKLNNKYDLAKVKQEKSESDEPKETGGDSEETVLADETSRVEDKNVEDKKKQNGLSLEDKDDHDNSGDDTPNEKKTEDDVEENRKNKNKVIEDMEDNDEHMKDILEHEDGLKKGANEETEEKDNGKATSEAKGNSDVDDATKDGLGTVASPVTETIDLDKEKDIPRPRALHRTSSIFLRNLAPSITKEEIEAICKRFDGYLRVAIADPLVERRWYRRGWVTFKRDVNIKEYCWNLNNTRLRDCEMGAIVNRDLSRRVRPVNGMTAHKTIVRSDIKLCARVALNLDEKFKLWSNDVAEKSNKTQEFNTSASYGFKSNNPVLHNITDYLIEEASAEEDELLGLTSRENKDTDGEVIERDPQLISVLDCLILYLRIVHSVDFYNHCEYPYEDEMPNRCGIIHARGPTPQKVTQNDMQDYIKNFEAKMQTFLAKTTTIEEEDLKNLGCKDAEAEVEKFVQANTQELAKDKWLCPLSGKKFKGPEFIRKHIFNKHMDKVDEVRKEVEFFNNFLRDPKRPQLPEHPGNTKRTNSESGGGYRAPAYPPVYPPYAAYAPPMMMPGRGGRGFGGRRPGGEYRQIIQYRDLDAPQDPVDMFN